MFEDLEKKLESYYDSDRSRIVAKWRSLIMPELKSLSKRINPFTGTGKPNNKSIFGTSPAKKKEVVSIWGVHPNVASDPIHYPIIPPEGFHEIRPRRVKFKSGVFKTVTKGQTHLYTLSRSIYNKDPLHFFYTLKGRVYGISDTTKKPVPAYSERSLPEMVKDYEGLEDLIRVTFEKAIKEVVG